MDARRKILDVLQGKSEGAIEKYGPSFRLLADGDILLVTSTIRALKKDGLVELKQGNLVLTRKGQVA